MNSALVFKWCCILIHSKVLCLSPYFVVGIYALFSLVFMSEVMLSVTLCSMSRFFFWLLHISGPDFLWMLWIELLHGSVQVVWYEWALNPRTRVLVSLGLMLRSHWAWDEIVAYSVHTGLSLVTSVCPPPTVGKAWFEMSKRCKSCSPRFLSLMYSNISKISPLKRHNQFQFTDRTKFNCLNFQCPFNDCTILYVNPDNELKNLHSSLC